jgi:outer membrane lipase/esterase
VHLRGRRRWHWHRRAQINSALCNTNTIVSGVDYNRYVFADRVYPTPQAHRLFGEYAYNRVRARW